MNYNSLICKIIHDNPENWKEVVESHSIRVKMEGDLAIFNYGLTTGPLDPETNTKPTIVPDYSDPVVQEARGIIIDTKKKEVVCWPFRKFGNHIESYVDNIDWNTAKIQDKLDGSIMKLFNDKRTGEWKWATNGIIDANKTTNSFGYNFGRLIRSSVNYPKLDYSKLNPDYTYIFELVSPLNTIVIKYPETKLYHLGTRNNITGKELDENIGIEKPKEYPLHSLSDCIEAAKSLNDGISNTVAKEGFVVVDGNFNRIKIKSPEYLIYHHAVSEPVMRKEDAINLLLNSEFDSKKFCKNYPKFEVAMKYYDFKLSELFSRSDEMIEYTRNMFEEYSNERKAVAMQLKNHPMFVIGMWGLDHPEGTARDFWLYNIDKLYRVIPKHEKILLTDMVPDRSDKRSSLKTDKSSSVRPSSSNIKNELWYQNLKNKQNRNEKEIKGREPQI